MIPTCLNIFYFLPKPALLKALLPQPCISAVLRDFRRSLLCCSPRRRRLGRAARCQALGSTWHNHSFRCRLPSSPRTVAALESGASSAPGACPPRFPGRRPLQHGGKTIRPVTALPSSFRAAAAACRAVLRRPRTAGWQALACATVPAHRDSCLPGGGAAAGAGVPPVPSRALLLT